LSRGPRRAPGTTTVIGIDAATDSERVGLALGVYRGGALRVERARLARKTPSVGAQVLEWIGESPAVLLAIDAPLGWPRTLGATLATHAAGRPIEVDADTMFRRHTDRIVKARIGKTPLDVGADRIARTALAALKIIATIERESGRTVDLAWKLPPGRGIHAIEAYPAGTLRSYMLSGLVGDPGGDTTERKRHLLRKLEVRRTLAVASAARAAMESGHVLDAVLCLVAAADFLDDTAIAPEGPRDLELAKKEGWIWVRSPGAKPGRRE
jgi:hypothetical protein